MKNFVLINTALALLAVSCNSSNDKSTNNADSSAVQTTTSTSTTTRRTVEISPVIQNSFAKSYPMVKDVDWVKYEPVPELEQSDWEMMGWRAPDTSDYSASFVVDSSKYYAWYTPEGDMIGSMTTVDSTNLPAPVNTSLHSQYVDYNISSVIKLKDKNKTAYQIKLNNGKDKIKILVGENGQIIRKK